MLSNVHIFYLWIRVCCGNIIQLGPNLYADDINHKTINDQNKHTH